MPAIDPTRCVAPPLVFERATTLDDLVEWAWDVPMLLLAEARPDGAPGYLALDRPLTFRGYVADGYHGRRATIADWELHLSLTYPDLRMRRQLELRQCDVVPPEALPALPALAKGLFYDLESRQRVLSLFGDGDVRIDRTALRAAACRDALDARVGDLRVRDVARETLAIARAGLASLARAGAEARPGDVADPDAAPALDILDAIVAAERPPFWQQVAARWAVAPGLAGLADPA